MCSSVGLIRIIGPEKMEVTRARLVTSHKAMKRGKTIFLVEFSYLPCVLPFENDIVVELIAQRCGCELRAGKFGQRPEVDTVNDARDVCNKYNDRGRNCDVILHARREDHCCALVTELQNSGDRSVVTFVLPRYPLN
jgi:hypothetical protein